MKKNKKKCKLIKFVCEINTQNKNKKTFCSKSKPQFSFCKVCYFHVKVVSNEGESMLVLFKFKIKVHILGQINDFE